MQSIIDFEFNEHLNTSIETMKLVGPELEVVANICIDTFTNKGKILLFGNGGSAADAQHIAAELIGRYKIERMGLPAIALTTDSSILTCISNDYSYDYVFSRQIEALASDKDTIIGISTGGTSPNVVEGIKTANDLGCKTIGFSGRGGGLFNNLCDVNLIVPSDDTPRIQEMHILIGHTICQLIDCSFRK